MYLIPHVLQALELDGLLAGGAGVAQGGVRTVSARGVALYDVLALKDELLQRWVSAGVGGWGRVCGVSGAGGASVWAGRAASASSRPVSFSQGPVPSPPVVAAGTMNGSPGTAAPRSHSRKHCAWRCSTASSTTPTWSSWPARPRCWRPGRQCCSWPSPAGEGASMALCVRPTLPETPRLWQACRALEESDVLRAVVDGADAAAAGLSCWRQRPARGSLPQSWCWKWRKSACGCWPR